jgi:hypothetical protein
MKKLTGMLLVSLSLNTYAQMYVAQESNGDIIYSDKPIVKTQPVLLSEQKFEPIVTIKDIRVNNNINYKTFHIVLPTQKQIPQNQVTFVIEAEPKLKLDNKIQVFIDGRLKLPTYDKKISADLIEDGSNVLYDLIMNQNKQSNMARISVQRTLKDNKKVSPQQTLTINTKMTPKQESTRNTKDTQKQTVSRNTKDTQNKTITRNIKVTQKPTLSSNTKDTQKQTLSRNTKDTQNKTFTRNIKVTQKPTLSRNTKATQKQEAPKKVVKVVSKQKASLGSSH